MLRCFLSRLFFLGSSSLCAMLAGNPANPALMDKGIISKISCVSLRIGYLNDWIYKQRFKEEFLIADETRTKNQLSTYAGMATFNVIKRLDIYSFLGASKMQVDDQIIAKMAFSWCVGSKLVFLKHKNFFLGADVKYFATEQKPQFFLVEGLPYNIVGEFIAKYFEAQASLGMAYRMGLFVPYANATYIYTHISHFPADVAIRFPDEDLIGNTELPSSMICQKRWGMTLGFSLVDFSKAALAFEWRVFNQNAINVNGEIRF